MRTEGQVQSLLDVYHRRWPACWLQQLVGRCELIEDECEVHMNAHARARAHARTASTRIQAGTYVHAHGRAPT